MIRGYDVYVACRKIRGWTNSTLDNYLASGQKEYYEVLANYLFTNRRLDKEQLIDFIRANYIEAGDTFDPFSLMNEEAWNRYQYWLNNASTKALYLEEVRKSVLFIENFCLQKKIDLNEYKLKYAKKHIREKKIDYCVAVYLDLVDVKKLKKVEKLLLQNLISQYNIIKVRLENPELKNLIETLAQDMLKIISESKN